MIVVGGGSGGLLSGSGFTIDTNSNYVISVGSGGASVSSNCNGSSATNSFFITRPSSNGLKQIG